METQILIATLTCFSIVVVSFTLGWFLCLRASAGGRHLQNKLVADSLPAYRALQRAEEPPPQDARPNRHLQIDGLPPDPFSRGTEIDEDLVARGLDREEAPI